MNDLYGSEFGDALALTRAYAMFNPHASFRLTDSTGTVEIKATDPGWNKWNPNKLVPPCWFNGEQFRDLIVAYLAEENTGAQPLTVRVFMKQFLGFKGSRKQKKVAEQVGLTGQYLHGLVSDREIDTDKTCQLLAAMYEESRPVKARQLGIIGRGHITESLVKHYGVAPECVRYACELYPNKRNGNEYDLPFVLEVAFGICRAEFDDESRRIVSGINWSPAISPPFAELLRFLASTRIDAHDPVVVVVHLACPTPRFTDPGKSRMPLPPGAEAALGKCINRVARDWKREKRQADKDDRISDQQMERLRIRNDRLKRSSVKRAAYEVMADAYLETSSNGTYPANARQIMYRARPKVLKLSDGQCWKRSSMFTQHFLPDFIKENPELTKDWDVVYDARGRLTEPHTGRVIDLGTRQVREYVAGWQEEVVPDLVAAGIKASYPTFGPLNRFKFALFVEKEGFAPLLAAANIASRFDLAIMSTKGMSVTAARMLVERLSEQGVTILVLRDFDKSGFSILHTLSSDSRRYVFKAKPKVIDLGLRLEDVLSMGLESEPVWYDQKVDPRVRLRQCGATEAECDFLVKSQTARNRWAGDRVELNAMNSEQWIAFLERRLLEVGVSKLIPGQEVLERVFKRAVEAYLIRGEMKKIASRANREAQTVEIPESLLAQVSQMLVENPQLSWDLAIAELQEQIWRAKEQK